MMLVKASQDSPGRGSPRAGSSLPRWGKYNEGLVKAGVLLTAEGLPASSKGARIKFSKDQRTVTDGPFTEAKELIAGFWLIQVGSKEEAIEWASRIPFEDGEVEIRQVFEASDFPPEILTPEEAAREQAMRDQLLDMTPQPCRAMILLRRADSDALMGGCDGEHVTRYSSGDRCGLEDRAARLIAGLA
jgi:hypothetical protein